MTKKKRITYIAGTQAEIKAYTVPNIPKHKLKCPHKGGHSTAAQKRYNDKKEKEKLVLKAENTYDAGCWLVTYTFTNEHLPRDAQSAAKNIKASARNIKKYFKNKKCECACMGAIEIGAKGGLHGHMLYPFYSQKDRDIIKKYWSYGHVDIKYVPGINNDRKCNVHGRDIKAVVLYVFKDPLIKIIGRSYKEPRQETFEITDTEFETLKKNPIESEKEMDGYRMTSSESRDFQTWWGRYQHVKIRLVKQQNDRLFADGEIYKCTGATISRELLYMVDLDQRQMWSFYLTRF